MLKSFTRVDGHHDSALLQWCELEDARTGATQAAHVYQLEMAQRLSTALATLKPRHRQVIDAEYFGDRPATAPTSSWGFKNDRVPLTEIARALGHKRDRVMKWKRTALKQLRQSLS